MLSSFKELSFFSVMQLYYWTIFQVFARLFFFFGEAGLLGIELNSRGPLLLRCGYFGVSTECLKCSLYSSWIEYYSPWPAITKWLKQQKFIFLQFRKLEVQVQGPSRVGIWRGLFPVVVDGCLLTVCSHDLFVHVRRERAFWCLF